LIEKDSTHYLDTSGYLSGSSQYWYLLQSINYTGVVSRYSTPVSARIERVEPADAPRSFFGYADGAAVRLFWTRSSDNTVTGYNVYRIPDADTAAWTRITQTPLADNSGSYTDTSGTVGNAYRYRMCALDPKGVESAPSHELRVVLFEPAPLPPAGIRISPEGASLSIVWNKTMQPSVVGYRVYRRTETEEITAITAEPLPVQATSYLDNAAKRNVRYYYSVACVDKHGRESIHSPEVPYLRD
jgi:fibronectin type 3 domain-containing protein